MTTCLWCCDDIHLFDKAPDGFSVTTAGQGWALDVSGDEVDDFVCPARESSGRWPDGRPHEPLKLPVPRVTIPEEAWETYPADTPRPWDQMLATVEINGRLFHANAWRVYVDEDGVQVAHDNDDSLAEIHSALTADGHWETLDIFDDEYVLILEPYC